MSVSIIPDGWNHSDDMTQVAGSISCCIGKLRQGESEVAMRQLWQRYFRRVIGLARKRLRNLPRTELDEEDIAVMALENLFRGIRAGRYPWLRNRRGIWPLLAAIASRKAVNQCHRLCAAKRAHLKVRSIDDVAEGSHCGEQHESLPGPGLDPQKEAILAETCLCLYRSLPNDQMRCILQLKLKGYSNREIAQALGLSERTIERKFVLIREHASRMAMDSI